MFAGPNGSGKSTLKGVLRPDLLGFYVNADEIEVALRSVEGFDFALCGLSPSDEELRSFFRNSSLLQKTGFIEFASEMPFQWGRLIFARGEGNSYVAAVVVDFVRRALLDRKASFAFETVMSSRDKVLLLREAQRLGYRTYLYYVATDDPEINLSRIARRVRKGGHDVPRTKVLERYERSLGLLPRRSGIQTEPMFSTTRTRDMPWCGLPNLPTGKISNPEPCSFLVGLSAPF